MILRALEAKEIVDSLSVSVAECKYFSQKDLRSRTFLPSFSLSLSQLST